MGTQIVYEIALSLSSGLRIIVKGAIWGREGEADRAHLDATRSTGDLRS